MNTQSNAMPGSSAIRRQTIARTAPAVDDGNRPFYWSVRRELWENRSIYIAPLAVAGVTLFGFLIATHRPCACRRRTWPRRRAVLAEPYTFAMGLIMGTAFIVGIFYSLDALHGERRDRSILFWKSLPVSDLTTVLSKATIPTRDSAAARLRDHRGHAVDHAVAEHGRRARKRPERCALWTQVSLFQISLVLLYHLVTVHVLWYAPIYGWLLLVSAWARRAPFLWAVLPLLAIGIVEKIAFNTSHFATLLQNHFMGSSEATPMAGGSPIDAMTHTSGRHLASPGLWVGLIIAAAFLAAAVRLRRYRDPI